MLCDVCKSKIVEGPFHPRIVDGVQLCGRSACEVQLEQDRLSADLEGEPAPRKPRRKGGA